MKIQIVLNFKNQPITPYNIKYFSKIKLLIFLRSCTMFSAAMEEQCKSEMIIE